MWHLVNCCGKCLFGRMSWRCEDTCRTGLRRVGCVNRWLTGSLSHPAAVPNITALLPKRKHGDMCKGTVTSKMYIDVQYTVFSLLFNIYSYIMTYMFWPCWDSIIVIAQRLHKNSAKMENIKNLLKIIFL